VLKELQLQYDNLVVVTIPLGTERNAPGKKYALSVGVAHAKCDWLLLTDADCAPVSNSWLERMTAPLANGKEIVAGYGGYRKMPGLLNAFTRWETIHAFLQYSTYTLAGRPYMAVGRNMACIKSTLQKAQQSGIWKALLSGDDDLLVRVAGNAHNTAIVCDEMAFTYTESKTTWAEWARQIFF